MKKKSNLIYECQQCGATRSKWEGQCSDCNAWNSFVEQEKKPEPLTRQHWHNSSAKICLLSEITELPQSRIPTHIGELDRSLGGGIVPGSVILLGGDPGIGKSTLLLQTLSALSANFSVLYVSGEESGQQVRARAKRLQLPTENIHFLPEIQTEAIVAHCLKQQSKVVVIDSIQTLASNQLNAAAGSVSQVRESAAALVRMAKTEDVAVFLVGHVTKEGTIAGPRILEHMVDTVLSFESSKDSRFRFLRALKNRFGAVNELGIFAMTERGLKGVANPSSVFLNAHHALPGSAVSVIWEGTRPILLEIQALVQESVNEPKRVSIGFNQQRLHLILAVLSRQLRMHLGKMDVYINIVGGLEIEETALDLAVAAAIISSFKQQPLSEHSIVLGEIGLTGEIRPVNFSQERLKEAQKLGFQHAFLPKRNGGLQFDTLKLHPLDSLPQFLQLLELHSQSQKTPIPNS